ncbi:MAG: hypothetical protein NUW37_01380 [Planctomycetes bacterium]|nr:hypothetical protein [Planctomycetota bacterium]
MFNILEFNWPIHILAIPITIFVGVYIGWTARGYMKKDGEN